MLERIQTPAHTITPADVERKIRHLTSSIRRRERLVTWDGYATLPSTPQS
ncbi:hypothetical protein [Cryobacterium cryoconiti]|nr:hypothetical protein [Cryobacterium cryoconiti]